MTFHYWTWFTSSSNMGLQMYVLKLHTNLSLFTQDVQTFATFISRIRGSVQHTLKIFDSSSMKGFIL